MGRLGYALAALLICGQPAFSQEKESSVILVDPLRIAGLQLDLLLEQRRTLEAVASWLNAEQRILNDRVLSWERSRADLQEHLNRQFDCRFDLDTRKCQETENGQDQQGETGIPRTPGTGGDHETGDVRTD